MTKKQKNWYSILSDRMLQRFSDLVEDALKNTPLHSWDDPIIDYGLLREYKNNSLMREMAYNKSRRLCMERIGI